jgi:hypothetical protein
MIGRVRARAVAAMAHKDISWIREFVPAKYQDNPRVIAKLLLTASEGDPALADKASYREAYAALGEMADIGALRDRASALYHNAKIQNLAGDRLDWFLAHPAAALERLKQLERSGELPEKLAYDVQLCFEEAKGFGAAEEAAVAPSAVPVGAAAEAERARLISKSATGRLSAAEEARLTAIYEARVASDDRAAAGQAGEELAAHRKALGGAPEPRGAPKPRGGEYERLIDKSVQAPLSADESARLTGLAGERAVESGQMTSDQLAEESENG